MSIYLIKVFSSGETSRTQDSSNCSVGKGNYDGVPYPTKLLYINERKADNSKANDSKKTRKAPRGIQLIIIYSFQNYFKSSSLLFTYQNINFTSLYNLIL